MAQSRHSVTTSVCHVTDGDVLPFGRRSYAKDTAADTYLMVFDARQVP
jgi:hypothetical protein